MNIRSHTPENKLLLLFQNLPHYTILDISGDFKRFPKFLPNAVIFKEYKKNLVILHLELCKFFAYN